MRALFVTQPFTSHFFWLVPYAHALQQAGHTIAFASSASFNAKIEGLGYTSFPCGVDFMDVRLLDVFPELRERSANEQDEFVQSNLFAGNGLARMTAGLLDLCRSWQPDVLVYDPLADAVVLVGEMLGIPYASIGGGFISPTHASELASYLLSLESLRRTYHLPPDLDGRAIWRYLVFEQWPPSMVPQGSVIMPTCHFIHAPPFNQWVDERLPNWFAMLPDRPIVHATMGTLWNRFARDIYAKVLAGLREELLTLIVTVGSDLDPASFGPQPQHIFIEQYIPHTLLLPRCDVLITHAGIGSVFAALDAGLPLIAMPITADQPRNAARCEAAGVGMVLLADQCTPERVREVTRKVLHEPHFREHARQIQAEMRALPGMSEAVALLEQLAREKQPILAREY